MHSLLTLTFCTCYSVWLCGGLTPIRTKLSRWMDTKKMREAQCFSVVNSNLTWFFFFFCFNWFVKLWFVDKEHTLSAFHLSTQSCNTNIRSNLIPVCFLVICCFDQLGWYGMLHFPIFIPNLLEKVNLSLSKMTFKINLQHFLEIRRGVGARGWKMEPH